MDSYKDPESEKVNIAMEEILMGNFLEGEKLLVEAAKAGSGHAAHNLGTLYTTGCPGIKPDSQKMLMYYE